MPARKPSIVDLLRCVLDAPMDASTSDMAATMGLTPALFRRAIDNLAAEGWLAEGAGGRLVPGSTALSVAYLINRSFPLVELAAPHLKRLVEATGESIVLNVYDANERMAVCVAVCESPNPLRYSLEVGEIKSLHAGASGKAILAVLPREVRKLILSRPLSAVTDRTVTNADLIEKELETIRDKRFVISHGQRIPGAVGIAACISIPWNMPASLVITVPEHRFTADRESELVGSLVAAARELELAFEDGGRVESA